MFSMSMKTTIVFLDFAGTLGILLILPEFVVSG